MSGGRCHPGGSRCRGSEGQKERRLQAMAWGWGGHLPSHAAREEKGKVRRDQYTLSPKGRKCGFFWWRIQLYSFEKMVME